MDIQKLKSSLTYLVDFLLLDPVKNFQLSYQILPFHVIAGSFHGNINKTHRQKY